MTSGVIILSYEFVSIHIADAVPPAPPGPSNVTAPPWPPVSEERVFEERVLLVEEERYIPDTVPPAPSGSPVVPIILEIVLLNIVLFDEETT